MMANVNFVVLKINDIDVSQLPQQQQKTALSMLLNEETDNVVLELKRKSCWNTNQNVDFDDIEISKKLCYLKIHHNAPLLDNNVDNNSSSTTIGSDIIVNLHLPTSTLQQYCMAKSTQTEDIAFYVHEHLRNIQKDTERLIEHEHNLFEQSLAPEIDIEEITLRKSDSNERLGITVCYSNTDDYAEGGGNTSAEMYNETVVTEVYISDIHPDSVAGRDGRLRQGDQILQINGKDIKTRPETETLIAENNNAVTLLVSRYLYADEDDFNDPSTNEDDDEVLVVEDDEDDDDEDDEFYEDNNMTYVNCVINNDCCINATEELDKALMSQVAQQEQLQQTGEKLEKLREKCNINTSTSMTHSNSAYQSTSLKSTSDGQKEKLVKNERKSWITGSSSSTKSGKNLKSNSAKIETIPGVKTHDDYETEHIYETIPEDPESEPFYCSPYDSSVYVNAMTSCSSSTITDALQHLQQKQRVAQWLGIKPLQDLCATTAPRQSVRSSYGGGRSSAFFNKSGTGTVRSAITTLTNGSVDCIVGNITLPGNCQLEDQDNSSSAYNTGGSNNSVSPLTLMLNPKNRSDQSHTLATSVINPPTNGVIDDGIGLQQIHQKSSAQQKTHSPKDKSKITSPKSGTFQIKANAGPHKVAVMDVQMHPNILDKNKETNVHRNMLLKQHLFNQKMCLEKSLQPHPLQQRTPCYYQQQPDQIQCPQFTAPNLSQYHFVSSQEVNNLSLNNKMPKSSTTVASTIANNPKKEEETMVWKVKRRPDGTRYIVRRPAKNRVIKDRNSRMNVERLRNDITTTEDDTISEIKTGRYWTKEERKKHIEKAKERRQQQQLIQQQQNKAHLVHDDSTAATLCIGDTILQDPCERDKIKHQQYLNLIRQHQQKTSQQQQHYQLQFNSAEDHKHSASLHNMESPTKKTSSTLPTTSEEFSTVKANMDQSELLNPNVFSSSEHNQINSSLQSVTTT
ncbi:slo-interacting protein 1 [Lucilia sericata]|uniref:slo-interacting protein 1 n=1 Tax=Lucilia sericata TaxID=13632 RepID=UPI0018A81B64|nr:slo-interacting protein 1 [Lucilia sericata]